MVCSTQKTQIAPQITIPPKIFRGRTPRPPSIKRFPLPAKNPVLNPVLCIVVHVNVIVFCNLWYMYNYMPTACIVQARWPWTHFLSEASVDAEVCTTPC